MTVGIGVIPASDEGAEGAEVGVEEVEEVEDREAGLRRRLSDGGSGRGTWLRTPAFT